MITGFVVDEDAAKAVNEAAAKAQTDRGQSVYWLPGSYKVFSGPHAGGFLVPFDELTRQSVLTGGKTALDFPEFEPLVASLGGEAALVTVSPSALIDPDSEAP